MLHGSPTRTAAAKVRQQAFLKRNRTLLHEIAQNEALSYLMKLSQLSRQVSSPCSPRLLGSIFADPFRASVSIVEDPIYDSALHSEVKLGESAPLSRESFESLVRLVASECIAKCLECLEQITK